MQNNMQYNDLKKVESHHRILGYCLMNLNDGNSCVIKIGKKNSLIVLGKVEYFDYLKGYTPCEVSYEDMINIMATFEGVYSLDKISLDKFLNFLEVEPELTEHAIKEIEYMRNWQPEAGELYTLGTLDIDDDDNLFNLNS
jgi:hypothetical protein